MITLYLSEIVDVGHDRQTDIFLYHEPFINIIWLRLHHYHSDEDYDIRCIWFNSAFTQGMDGILHQ